MGRACGCRMHRKDANIKVDTMVRTPHFTALMLCRQFILCGPLKAMTPGAPCQRHTHPNTSRRPGHRTTQAVLPRPLHPSDARCRRLRSLSPDQAVQAPILAARAFPIWHTTWCGVIYARHPGIVGEQLALFTTFDSAHACAVCCQYFSI